MEFTNHLWACIEKPIFKAILKHPFIQGLTNGTLEERRFKHYVIQDSLYLKAFSKGLALLGTQATLEADRRFFIEQANTAIEVEKLLHLGFLKEWNINPEIIEATPPAPTCLLYTNYLLQTAYSRPYHEVIGAFLPCYWIYLEVGKALIQKSSPNPLYRRWIDTYADKAFEASVHSILNIVEREAKELNQGQKEALKAHFIRGCELEWLFWQMGYNEETWPLTSTPSGT